MQNSDDNSSRVIDAAKHGGADLYVFIYGRCTISAHHLLRERLKRVLGRLQQAPSLTNLGDAESALADLKWLSERVILHRTRITMHQNAARPVFRLPSEVLLRIFELAMFTCHMMLDRGDATVIPPTALAFSQVCREWRTLALGCPLLWTEPIFTWPCVRAGLELSERARGLPLSIVVDVHPQPRYIEPYVALVNRHWHKIRRLVVAGGAEMVLGPLRTPRGGSSIVEELVVVIFGTTAAELNFELFGGPSPHLHSLTLERCYVRPPSAMLATLTSLRLNLQRCQTRLGLHFLLQMLANTPLLRFARLVYCLPVEDPITHHGNLLPPGLIVALPQLVTFVMEDYVACFPAVVTRLSLPSTAVVDLRETAYWGNISHVIKAFTLFRLPGTESHTSLQIHVTPQRVTYRSQAGQDHSSVFLSLLADPFRPQLSSSRLPHLMLWPSLMHLIAGPTVRDVCICVAPDAGEPPWMEMRNLLERLPGLTRLCVEMGAVMPVLLALNSSCDEMPLALHLPVLQELSIVGIMVTPKQNDAVYLVGAADDEDNEDSHLHRDSVGLLKTFLRAHKATRGIPPQLTMRRCIYDGGSMRTTLSEYMCAQLGDLVSFIAISG
jgi:hypothetical protein